MNKLIIAAHPDDEILGASSVIKGADVLLLNRGRGVPLETIRTVHRFMKVKSTHILDLPDNRYDSVPLLTIVKKIEEIKDLLKPTVIYTHWAYDLNIDHRITYQAVLTATRPVPGECVKEIYSFEVLSSSEWNFGHAFNPDTFIKVDTMKKTEDMIVYDKEIKIFPHPRSVRGIDYLAAYRGMSVGMIRAEAFKTIRRII